MRSPCDTREPFTQAAAANERERVRWNAEMEGFQLDDLLRQIFEQPFTVALGTQQVEPCLATDVEALDGQPRRSRRRRC